jgi:hypothetical protein
MWNRAIRRADQTKEDMSRTIKKVESGRKPDIKENQPESEYNWSKSMLNVLG